MRLNKPNRRTVLKGIGASAVGGTVLSSSVTAKPADARVNLHPVNLDASGNRIHGKASIDDTGAELVVTGTARGMDPANNEGYVSLFYDIHSKPDGPNACEPEVPPEHEDGLTQGQMLGAVWTVDQDGVGTAHDLPEDQVDLSEIGTMSIRDVRINDGFGPEAVVACGKVVPAHASRD